MPIISYQQAIKRYGIIAGSVWEGQNVWLRPFLVPTGINLTYQGKPVRRFSVNKDLAGPLLAALAQLLKDGVAEHLRTFDGCFNIRPVRGCSGRQSTHSYGLAVDFNAAENPLGAAPQMHPQVVAAFKAEGFTWGGDFQRPDGMHFSLAWE